LSHIRWTAEAGEDGAIDVVDGLITNLDRADMAVAIPLSTRSRSWYGDKDVVSSSVLAADIIIIIIFFFIALGSKDPEG